MTSPALDRVLDAVLRVSANLQIEFISQPGQRWLTQIANVDLPRAMADLLSSDDLAVLRQWMDTSPDYFVCDLRITRGNAERWISLRGYTLAAAKQFVLCIFDISAWKADQSALRHAAEHDDLTGLPNRYLLKKIVDKLIQDASRVFSVGLLDLDGFKKVNDTYGHAMGDAVLVETTKRLLKIIGPNDVLARLGGDEFLLLFDSKDANASKVPLTKVLQSIARPFETAPHNAYLGASIGIAEFPAHGTDYASLLKNADAAMYHSKSAGKNKLTVFTLTETNVDFSIKAAIHEAIEEGEFFMEFQPQFDLDRKLVGAEALMRWTSTDFGRVSPDKFIPIIEESGLMPFMGKWALRYASHQLKAFQKFIPDFVMSVNVSPVQFGDPEFHTLVLDTVQESGIMPTTLILEITESTLMQSQERTERSLAILRDKGIRFSIDDFGTGFSSLAYLTRLPVSSIKIDKAFIRAIESVQSAASTDKRLVIAMINLAHSIDLKVVAEGVEKESQFDFLKSAGCNLIQGYLLAKPLTSADLIKLLQLQSECHA